ncbi:MAG: AbrB/MazE/SpoVT family DNA-binding domain-containing protein [bacterium]|nr:AbrB/MazE/SpoVT family DNA-binding domain-containing protein [bacterium]
MPNRTTINERGVVTIPAALRRAFGLEAGAELFIEQTAEGILLRPSISVPIEFYTEERIAEFASDEQAIENLLPKPK